VVRCGKMHDTKRALLLEDTFLSSCSSCPPCVLLAGSGKTTLMQRLCSHVSQHGIRSYVINLDPAVLTVPHPANIDIRDTVNYKNVMKEYRLGPTGNRHEPQPLLHQDPRGGVGNSS